jgi:hypothetical protein
MKRYCKCGSEIPAARIRILPNTTTCVKCSEIQPVSGVLIVHHKTGNEVQVIHDKETAKHIKKLSTRQSYGAVKTLESKSNVSTNYGYVKKSKVYDPARIQHITERALDMSSMYDFNRVKTYVTEFFDLGMIDKDHLNSILQHVIDQSYPTLKSIKSTKNAKDVHTNVNTQIDKDIIYCFQNWKK